MSKADTHGFGKFVPGFDFLQQLAQGGNASLAGWIAPTLDAQALDKRIEELKAVQFWLDQNAAALKATIQALEVQKMTLATLKSMNVPLAGAWTQAAATPAVPPTPPAPQTRADAPSEPRPAAQRKARAPSAAAPAGAAAPALPDPMQFWGALTRQFQQIAAGALQDVAARGAAAAPAAPPPAKKAAARRRKQA